jgi:tRNA(Ile)-lysidine synthase
MTSTVRRAVETAIEKIGQGLYGVACSGGPDSMALADAAIDVAGAQNVVVMTIDHGLQRETAEIAERVAAWARARGAAAVIERVQTDASENAARNARYAALDHLAEQLGVSCVMLGHTARDQAETVLMRILRGTGPAGLAGIPARRGFYVRPLLEIDRGAIDAYVADRQLPVWLDPMNNDARYLRSRIRNELLPSLRRENPNLDDALVRLAKSITEWLEVIDDASSDDFPIDVTMLREQPAAIRKRSVSRALEARGISHDATHLEAIDALILAPTRGELALDLPGACIVRRYDTLGLRDDIAPTLLTPPDGPYELRVWQPGDRMKPRRLRGRSRKLSDLYIDAKVPRSLRETARVVIRTTDSVIVWAEHIGTAFEEPETVVPRLAK